LEKKKEQGEEILALTYRQEGTGEKEKIWFGCAPIASKKRDVRGQGGGDQAIDGRLLQCDGRVGGTGVVVAVVRGKRNLGGGGRKPGKSFLRLAIKERAREGGPSIRKNRAGVEKGRTSRCN